MNEIELKSKMLDMIVFAKKRNDAKSLIPTLVKIFPDGKMKIHEVSSEHPISMILELSQEEGVECCIVIMGAYINEINIETGKRIRYDALSVHGQLKNGYVLNYVIKDHMDGTYGDEQWNETTIKGVVGNLSGMMGGN